MKFLLPLLLSPGLFAAPVSQLTKEDRNLLDSCHNKDYVEGAKLTEKCRTLPEPMKEFNREYARKFKEADDVVRSALKKYHNDFADDRVLEATLEGTAARTRIELGLYTSYCKRYPKEEVFCLSEQEIADKESEREGLNCDSLRTHQIYKHAPDATKAQDFNLKMLEGGGDWYSLPSPKDCQVLLAKDRERFGLRPEETVRSESCEWVEDFPRRILSAPGCMSRSQNKVCKGYVACEQKGTNGTFVRPASCSADHCGPQDAIRCARQAGFHSEFTTGERPSATTNKMKRPTGVIKQ